jgi:transcriptional regulator with XRE-family HTH domain
MPAMSNDLNRRIGERLRAVRTARRLTNERLSARTNGVVSKHQISNIERGRTRPSIEAACALAKALGHVSAAHLLCLDVLAAPATDAPPGPIAPARQVSCAMFIERARAVHGERYDYSQTCADWTDTTHRVLIGCRQHGFFEQLPHSHLKGHGCPQCGIERIREHHALDAETVKQRVSARWPEIELISASFTGYNATAQWRCRRHASTFSKLPERLFYAHVPPCPDCRREAERAQRREERSRDAIADLVAWIELHSGAADAALYWHWLDGALRQEIAAELGITRDVVQARLVRIERLLDAVDGDAPSAGR